MKITASTLFLAGVFAVANVFADAANTLIAFSTPGPDKYADGVTVVDGERYALVWTAGEDFAGFTTSGEAQVPSQKVIYVAPLAKNGCCPLTLFQIDSREAPEGGVYSVYLLDTRGSAAKEQVVITGSALAKTYSPSAASSKIATVAEDKTVDGAGKAVALQSTTAGVAHDPAVVAPVITGFKVDGAKVKITVANVFPGFAYEVKGGLDKQGTVASEATPKANNTLELTVDKEAAKFFSIKAK